LDAETVEKTLSYSRLFNTILRNKTYNNFYRIGIHKLLSQVMNCQKPCSTEHTFDNQNMSDSV